MTDNSAMLLIVTILLIFMIIMGQITKARIYNLLAIAPMMYIAIAFINSIAIVILMIGLILYQLYLTIKI